MLVTEENIGDIERGTGGLLIDRSPLYHNGFMRDNNNNGGVKRKCPRQYAFACQLLSVWDSGGRYLLSFLP